MLLQYLKYAALVGYVISAVISRDTIIYLPVFLIAAGITVLSIFKSPFTNYVFNISLFSILVYMLVSYHEHNECIIEDCTTSETSAIVNIVSTIVAWSSIPRTRTPTKPKKIPVQVAVPVVAPTLKFPKLQWV